VSVHRSPKVYRAALGEHVLGQLEADAGGTGIQALRLDVTTANPFLEEYYLACGFQRDQTVEIFGERCVLLQKPIKRRQ